MMRRAFILLGMTLALSACKKDADDKTVVSQNNEVNVPAVAPQTGCGHQDLVGRNKIDVNPNMITGPVRVVYAGTPLTEEHVADRITIILEKGTDKILAVRCG